MFLIFSSSILYTYIYVYIYKVAISVCLFVCTIITHEPLTDLPQILSGELGRTTRTVLAWFLATLGSQAKIIYIYISIGVDRRPLHLLGWLEVIYIHTDIHFFFIIFPTLTTLLQSQLPFLLSLHHVLFSLTSPSPSCPPR